MKQLIIQSDDLGITRGVTNGIIEGIESGMVKNTGLFANMPSSHYAASIIKHYPHVCLGIDINIVAGRPCADPKDIPCMVHADGSFYTSGQSRQLDETADHHDHLDYEQCVKETKAQIERFHQLVGKYPEYIHGHSYSTATLIQAMEDVANEYQIPTTRGLTKEYGLVRPLKNWNKKPFTLEDQLHADQLGCIMTDEYLKADIGYIIFHCGYVDAPLFDVSTYTLIRPMDLKACNSEALKQWIQTNGIELISFHELTKGNV